MSPASGNRAAAGAGKAGLEVRVPARQRGVVVGATSLGMTVCLHDCSHSEPRAGREIKSSRRCRQGLPVLHPGFYF